MATVKWTPQALADLEAIGDFYAQDAPSYAQVVVDKLFEATRRLKAFPRSGRIVPEIRDKNIRELIYRNYRIVYLVNSNEVNILTVFHSSKRFDGLP